MTGSTEFSLEALFHALDAQRLERGLTWADDTTLLIDASITQAINDVRNILGKYEVERTIAAYTGG